MSRVGLAHDYLTQRGGAERVALTLGRRFSDSPFYTSVYAPESTYPEFSEFDVRTSSLQRFASFRKDPRLALPLLPRAWESLTARDVDVVLASTTGWAHALRREPGVPMVAYCHNPARWLYQPEEYEPSRLKRQAIAPLLARLRAWDQEAAARVTVYLANSTTVARRIRETYGREAIVVHPPVMVDVQGPREPVDGVEPGYWLSIARGRGYKNVDTVIEGVSRLPGQRLVIVGSAPEHGADEYPHVTWLGVVSEARLRWLYANARGLVSVSQEDFGLTPIEANAFGTPVAVLRGGGFLDSTDEGRSGVFVEAVTADAVEHALAGFPAFDPAVVRANAERFSVAAFTARIDGLLAEITAGRPARV